METIKKYMPERVFRQKQWKIRYINKEIKRMGRKEDIQVDTMADKKIPPEDVKKRYKELQERGTLCTTILEKINVLVGMLKEYKEEKDSEYEKYEKEIIKLQTEEQNMYKNSIKDNNDDLRNLDIDNEKTRENLDKIERLKRYIEEDKEKLDKFTIRKKEGDD